MKLSESVRIDSQFGPAHEIFVSFPVVNICANLFYKRPYGARARVIQLFSYSTQLSMKLIQLISVKMATIVGILTFISIINTTA